MTDQTHESHAPGHANRGGKRRSLLWPAVLVALALLAAGAWAAGWIGGTAPDAADGMPTALVQRGPLVISVSETGTVKPMQQVIVKSAVEGNNAILSLVPEGALVKEGDLLVQLDASRFVESEVEQQIKVLNAEAGFIRSSEQLAVAQNKAEADVAAAKLAYQFAVEDLKNYVDGQFPKDLKEAESKITIAREELERAAEKLKWSEKLFEEKFISQTEVESDRLSKQRAELDHELSQMALRLLKEFTYTRRLTELQADESQKKLALERTIRSAKADVVQAEADLRAKESEFRRQKDKLDKIQEQIAATRIVSPAAGMVVYASSAQGGWRGNSEPLAEGQQVRERQELIYLPTASTFMAEVKIHEASLQKIAVGQPTRITIDALPGKVFRGSVSRIAPLPDATSVWMNPDLKVYATAINVDGDQPDLRNGMSCKVEIIVAEYDDALYLPVQAVLRVKGQPTVWVVTPKELKATPVELGLDNARMVRVLSGVEEGQRVVLTPPLSASAAPLTTDKPARAKTAPPNAPPASPPDSQTSGGDAAADKDAVSDNAAASDKPATPDATPTPPANGEGRRPRRERPTTPQ